MLDLVLMRELIKINTAPSHSAVIGRVFAGPDFESLFESAFSRASLQYRPIDIALFSNHMGVKAINARARTGTDVEAFPRRGATLLNALLHLDIATLCYRSFNSAMDREHALTLRTSNHLLLPENAPSDERAERDPRLSSYEASPRGSETLPT